MIQYTVTQTPYGFMVLAVEENKIVGLAFGEPSQASEILEDLFPNQQAQKNDTALKPYVEKVISGNTSPEDLQQSGTPLQETVWTHLLRIPKGTTISYSELAQRVGRPRAVRAVASAVGRNKISLLVPCHRVIGKRGSLGGYRWGLPVKKRLLELEVHKCESSAH